MKVAASPSQGTSKGFLSWPCGCPCFGKPQWMVKIQIPMRWEVPTLRGLKQEDYELEDRTLGLNETVFGRFREWGGE